MFKKIYSRFTMVAVSVLCGTTLFAQSGAYSGFTPYSVFGIGDIAKDGSAYNRSMGGVGIATRNNRFINSMNPASVTAKDSLSFMADFGLTQNNTLYKQSGVKSGNNTFNINNFKAIRIISETLSSGCQPEWNCVWYPITYILEKENQLIIINFYERDKKFKNISLFDKIISTIKIIN